MTLYINLVGQALYDEMPAYKPTRTSIGSLTPKENKGVILNCCGKMPSLRKASLPGSYNLAEQLGTSLQDLAAPACLSRQDAA